MRFFSKQRHFQPQFHSKATQLSTHAIFTSNLEVGNDFCLFSCSWKGSVTRGTITFLSLLPCLLEANWWFLRSSQRKLCVHLHGTNLRCYIPLVVMPLSFASPWVDHWDTLREPTGTHGKWYRFAICFSPRDEGELFSFGYNFAGPMGHTHGICSRQCNRQDEKCFTWPMCESVQKTNSIHLLFCQ